MDTVSEVVVEEAVIAVYVGDVGRGAGVGVGESSMMMTSHSSQVQS